MYQAKTMKRYRKKLGLSHGQVARIAGITRQTYCDCENGNKTNTTVATIQAIAKALRCSPTEVWR
jgi:DNA-binding XRE family transcriptional regulator